MQAHCNAANLYPHTAGACREHHHGKSQRHSGRLPVNAVPENTSEFPLTRPFLPVRRSRVPNPGHQPDRAQYCQQGRRHGQHDQYARYGHRRRPRTARRRGLLEPFIDDRRQPQEQGTGHTARGRRHRNLPDRPSLGTLAHRRHHRGSCFAAVAGNVIHAPRYAVVRFRQGASYTTALRVSLMQSNRNFTAAGWRESRTARLSARPDRAAYAA